VSHRLLVRGGFIRQLSSGHYSMLPMGQRVRLNIDASSEEEMDAIGGQQFHLPALHPAEIWKKSGRWESMGDEMFRLVDRRGSDNALGMTHEEVFALLASELFSYRSCPRSGTRSRPSSATSPAPSRGLLRVREFTMKDSYSLDVDADGLDAAFDRHHAAYLRIFAFGSGGGAGGGLVGIMGGPSRSSSWCGVRPGRTGSSPATGVRLRRQPREGPSRLPQVVDPDSVPEPVRFATPDIRTIKALAEAFPDVAPPDRQIKTLVYVLDDVRRWC
jgi:prolyl-tRNA synthetase